MTAAAFYWDHRTWLLDGDSQQPGQSCHQRGPRWPGQRAHEGDPDGGKWNVAPTRGEQIEEKAKALLAQMTLDAKIHYLSEGLSAL